jgi:hypothetical protein
LPGLLADGRINPEEAEFFRDWLKQNRVQSYPFPQLLERINRIYSDGVATQDECDELAAMVRAFLEHKELYPEDRAGLNHYR